MSECHQIDTLAASLLTLTYSLIIAPCQQTTLNASLPALVQAVEVDL